MSIQSRGLSETEINPASQIIFWSKMFLLRIHLHYLGRFGQISYLHCCFGIVYSSERHRLELILY